MKHSDAVPAPPATAATYARVAGIGYLLIIVAGVFGEFVVRSRLLVAGDPAATAAGIAAAETLFRAGLAAELVMVTCDVIVAHALYMLFRPVSAPLALLAAFFRLAHAATVGVNLLNGYLPLIFLGEAAGAALGSGTTHALAFVALEAHAIGYTIGLLFFGAHCLVLAALALRAGFVPRALAGLLGIAGAAYLFDCFARTLVAGYAAYEPVLTLVVFVPAFVAELAFTAWLLVRAPRLRHLAPTPEAA